MVITAGYVPYDIFGKLSEPMDLYILPDGDMYWLEGPNLTPNPYAGEGAIKVGENVDLVNGTVLRLPKDGKGNVYGGGFYIFGVDAQGRETERRYYGPYF